VTARNQLDALVHSVKKSLTEYGDKIEADEKAKIEAALKDAEEALKGDDKDKIDARAQELGQASQKLGEKIYADAQAAQAAGAGAAGAGGAAGGPGGKTAAKDEGDVVDAEFTEVKDKKA
jgi:molecular chaperone DnaK